MRILEIDSGKIVSTHAEPVTHQNIIFSAFTTNDPTDTHKLFMCINHLMLIVFVLDACALRCHR